jgi:chemotaxis protein methyltransferase CheR
MVAPMGAPMAAAVAAAALEELEFDLLLEALQRHFGFDFRGYEQARLRRRLRALMLERGVPTVSALQDRALHDGAAGAALLRALSAAPVAMFDDPVHYAGLRAVLARCVAASPLPKVWLAECAGAEEAWTVAILLHEQGLSERAGIFATSANEQLLAEAAEACRSGFPAARLVAYEDNYRRSGGTARFADYFRIADGRATPLPHLSCPVTWAHYNPVTDASFNEFELIVCRRALADFGPTLRRRALLLFRDSLALFGVLGSGQALSGPEADGYRPFVPAAVTPVTAHTAVSPSLPWYQRVA